MESCSHLCEEVPLPFTHETIFDRKPGSELRDLSVLTLDLTGCTPNCRSVRYGINGFTLCGGYLLTQGTIDGPGRNKIPCPGYFMDLSVCLRVNAIRMPLPKSVVQISLPRQVPYVSTEAAHGFCVTKLQYHPPPPPPPTAAASLLHVRPRPFILHDPFIFSLTRI